MALCEQTETCLILHIRNAGMKSRVKLKFHFLVTVLQNGIPA